MEFPLPDSINVSEITKSSSTYLGTETGSFSSYCTGVDCSAALRDPIFDESVYVPQNVL